MVDERCTEQNDDVVVFASDADVNVGGGAGNCRGRLGMFGEIVVVVGPGLETRWMLR